MELAKGTVILSPENKQSKEGMTPGEVLILHRLHFRNANGSPLGGDWKVYGTALTVDVPAKAGEPEWFNQQSGKVVPATPAIPAKTHKRTNREEVERLRRKYTGTVKDDAGRNIPVFQAVFGTASNVQLPQTFDEIEDAVGQSFPQLSAEVVALSEADHERAALLKQRRPELVRLAIEHKLKVDVEDDNSAIVDAILEAKAKAVEKAEKGQRGKGEKGKGKEDEQLPVE
jgi:hypothetical protein